MPSPKLFIRRIVVEGELSYDQRFYPGLNIVHAIQRGNDPRSTNGCGKTSLVELIQHGLGRQQASKAKFHFAPIIEKLQTLWFEFETDNGIYTIQRSLNAITAAARLHEGPYMPGMEKAPAEVISIEDMSSLLLELMGIPEVSVTTQQGEAVPLSFPLLMRAFILHQEDSFGEILFKVQPESRKADIIGFMTGITPLARFPLEKEISDLKLQIQPLDEYVNSVTRFLVEHGVPTSIEANTQVEEAQRALELAKEEQRSLQRSIIQREMQEREGQTDQLRRQLFALKQEIIQVEQTYLGIQQEDTRLKELLASLRSDQHKSKHLQASTTQLSSVDFDICPRCLQDITVEMRQREHSARCSLCNRPLIVTSDTAPRRVLKTDDIDIQIEEANLILKSVQKELATYQDRLTRLREREHIVGRELEAQTAVYVSPSVDQLLAQADIISERQAELAKALSFLEQAQSLEELQTELNRLKVELAKREDELEATRKAIRQRQEAFRQVYEAILWAVDYPDLQTVTINSYSLMPYINNQLYIHQGTAYKGLATTCYHLAMLGLARQEDTYFPRMLVIDSPNAGDLNEENHAKLLHYMATLQPQSEAADLDWQIILTTRYLPPELERFVIDRISYPDLMLLRKRDNQKK